MHRLDPASIRGKAGNDMSNERFCGHFREFYGRRYFQRFSLNVSIKYEQWKIFVSNVKAIFQQEQLKRLESPARSKRIFTHNQRAKVILGLLVRTPLSVDRLHHQRWPESDFQTPAPLLFQNFLIRIRVQQFLKFENPIPVQTTITIDPTKIHQCFYLLNDHADSCYFGNWKVTPGPSPFFHKNLTPGSDPGTKKMQKPAGVDSGIPDPWPPLYITKCLISNSRRSTLIDFKVRLKCALECMLFIDLRLAFLSLFGIEPTFLWTCKFLYRATLRKID